MHAENKKNKQKSQHIWSAQMYRQWYDLQRQYAEKQWKLIEYPSESWELESWYVILNQDAKSQSLNRMIDLEDIDFESDLDVFNQALAKVYLSGSKPQAKFWKAFKQETEQTGILIPQYALVELGMPHFKKSLAYTHQLSKQFPFFTLLKQHHIHVTERSDSNGLVMYHTIWKIIENYIRILAKKDANQAHVINYLSVIWNTPNIDEALPSLQLTHALITLFIEMSRLSNPPTSFNSDHYMPEVANFMTTHLSDLETLFSVSTDSVKPKKEILDQLKILETQFYDLCLYDNAYMFMQELIDDPNQFDFLNSIPRDLKEELEKLNSNSFITLFNVKVKNRSIIDRLKSLSSSEVQIQLPTFYKNKLSNNEDRKMSWQQLSNESISQLIIFINDYTFSQTEEKQISNKRNQYLIPLLNRLTMPVLKWEIVQSTLMPLWNTCQHKETTNSILAYDEARALELKESIRYDKIKKSIGGISKESELEHYLNTIQPFCVDLFIDKLNQLVKTTRTNIINNRQFKLRKMEEFGITQELERSFRIREIYLNELLIIEEEVRPYILYVKKAFDSALPENRENFFDPYRHSIDGIEFDPETIQNVDKWLKGEVMKTIHIKQQIHEALQINCFAMDSSGSMDHTKMRNLFKLIYLIMIGLRGKASYDSFHFFGTYFIPAAEFNHSFDSKNLLYKILRNISHVNSEWQVEYNGVGGTNLSGAIVECQKRLNEFAKPFEKKEIIHFKSLFVITDGEPSIGVVEPAELTELVKQNRQDGGGSIKGIYVGPPSKIPFMRIIFGENEFVETENFEAAIIDLIDIMSRTFKQQRQHLKQAKKQR